MCHPTHIHQPRADERLPLLGLNSERSIINPGPTSSKKRSSTKRGNKKKDTTCRCYYGEYPLSFAASVGSVAICRLLYEFKRLRCSPSPSPSQSQSPSQSHSLIFFYPALPYPPLSLLSPPFFYLPPSHPPPIFLAYAFLSPSLVPLPFLLTISLFPFPFPLLFPLPLPFFLHLAHLYSLLPSRPPSLPRSLLPGRPALLTALADAPGQAGAPRRNAHDRGRAPRLPRHEPHGRAGHRARRRRVWPLVGCCGGASLCPGCQLPAAQPPPVQGDRKPRG